MIPFAFLEDIHKKFVKTYGRAILSAPAYAMNDEFSRVLNQQMEYYSNDPNADRLNRLKGEMTQASSKYTHLDLSTLRSLSIIGSLLEYFVQFFILQIDPINTLWLKNLNLPYDSYDFHMTNSNLELHSSNQLLYLMW